MSSKSIIVIIGCGGMGLAIARRLGSGSHLVLSDFSQAQLDSAAQTLRHEGHDVDTVQADISNESAAQSLAQAAARLGVVRVIAHTAGLSPARSPPDAIYKVDLLGVAHVIDAFLPVASSGTSLVIIASLAGHNTQGHLSADLERHLATAPASELLNHSELEHVNSTSAESVPRFTAYGVSKRGNILRVQAFAAAWGQKGARINTVSPGLILTAMGHAELSGPMGEHMQDRIGKNPVARVGTASDVANAVAFLCSHEASFITGTDILVDGGWGVSARWESKI
ncbi:hypothetical protein ASPVEDRAFT_35124 [Aspergillus versicolor CBS 583.65]|uniref:Uncharacterized protein n=1 Tax=Aspergillus versicolor CBS 583.65 TaxID=1036611 RepID=A0A1L9P2Q4_ASPVE|nr:uncharacterized protein ASPVEDRAFT_35124 [Aspergillus versicolor CBS 583.65]OJI95807.1 hypothetical protein ASPVEDRAFT_35124 [Aspergillus versicolor CBS 583.65]